jgi:replicative DNA helicase
MEDMKMKVIKNRTAGLLGMSSSYEDIDAERGFISTTRDEEGASLDIWAYALEKGITEDHFSQREHQEYFHAFKQADIEGEFGSIGAFIRLRKDFHKDYPFFHDTLLCCDTTFHGKSFVDRLVSAFKFRRLQRVALEITDSVDQAQRNTDPCDIARHIEHIAMQIIEPVSKSLLSAQEVAEETRKQIEEEKRQGGASIQTPIPYLNSLLDGGFRPGQMVVIAARPSVGKTTFGMNIMHHAGMKGKKILFFSLEMSNSQLGKKWAAIDQGVDLSKFADRKDNDTDRALLNKGLENLASLKNCWMDDASGQTMSQIRSKAKLMNRRNKLDAIFIDYLGLVEAEDKRDIREQQVAQISKMSKRLAKELGIVVFLVCQLNRDSAKTGAPPALHHLRESGQIEQDADIVIMIHRSMEAGKDTRTADIMVCKNRFGPIGHTNERVEFDRKTQRFIQKPPAPRLHDQG